MTIKKIVNKQLRILEETLVSKWTGSTYEILKLASPTEKGDWGEDEFFKDPNKFIPSRWTREMEKSYYAISFNQGPQRCPGKELVIYLAQSFLYNFIKIKKFTTVETLTIDKNYIPQIINPCTIYFNFN